MGEGNLGSDFGGRRRFLAALRMPVTRGRESARRLRGFLRVWGPAPGEGLGLGGRLGLVISTVVVWGDSVAFWARTVESGEVVMIAVWFVTRGVSGLDGASGVSGASDERRDPGREREAEGFGGGWEVVVGFGCSGVSGVSGGSSKTRGVVEEGMRFRRGGEWLDARGRLGRDGSEAA